MKVVELLMARGADVNKSSILCPPLISAVMYQHMDVVRALLRGGAEVDGRDRVGCTALWYAGSRGNAELVELLLSAGADVNARCDRRVTPLMMAAEWGNLPAVRGLLRAGADPTLVDADGRSALDKADGEGFPEPIDPVGDRERRAAVIDQLHKKRR